MKLYLLNHMLYSTDLGFWGMLKRLRLPSVGKEVENLRKSIVKEKEKSATKSQKNNADDGPKYKKPSIRGKLN